MTKVSIRNLTKKFGKLVAVDQLSIEINDKEWICLLGPSGCGKTTTLRCIAGLEKPDEGAIYFDDALVNNLSPRERDIAMVFQFYALYPGMTVYENLALPLKVKKVPRDEIKKRVTEIADVIGLGPVPMRKTKDLDVGQKQRVALGRALVRSPRVCLLDEPLTNLDAKLRAEMRVELKRLQREIGRTTIYVTHDQVEAMAMADRIAVMNLGKLEQIGTPDEVYNKPESMFVAGFIGSPAMNFINCTFVEKDGQSYLDAGSFTMSVTNLRDLIKESNDSEMILGVRPEDIMIAKSKASGDAYDAKVDVIEHLKPEMVIDLDVGGTTLKVLVPTTFEAAMGEKVWFTFNRFHIINKKTKKVII